MHALETVAADFIEIAHRVVWATVATVDATNRPRTRVLHPIWTLDDGAITGWIATAPTPVKTADLAHSPNMSVNYWDAAHDIATADCSVTWHDDDITCRRVWNMFADAPAPVGYDPSIIPVWDDPTQPEFTVLRLAPYRLRVFPGSLLVSGQGETLLWSSGDR